MFTVEKIDLPEISQKFGYVDDYYGKITEKNNDYYFEMYFVIVNDAVLPISSYRLSIINPNLEVMKVNLIESELLPKYIHNRAIPKYTKVFKASFVLSGASLLKTGSDYLSLTLGVSLSDSCLDALNSDQIIKANSYNNELKETSAAMPFEFNIEKPIKFGSSLSTVLLPVSCNYVFEAYSGIQRNYEDLLQINQKPQQDYFGAIKEVATLNCPNLTLTDIKYTINYQTLDDDALNTFTYESEKLLQKIVAYDLNFDFNTAYDFDTKKVTKTIEGINGFYLPIKSSGEINAELTIYDKNNNVHTIIFTTKIAFENDADLEGTLKVYELDEIDNFDNLKAEVFDD
jgi:hypothetical protein